MSHGTSGHTATLTTAGLCCETGQSPSLHSEDGGPHGGIGDHLEEFSGASGSAVANRKIGSLSNRGRKLANLGIGGFRAKPNKVSQYLLLNYFFG
ncbi:unnamed protein product [Protopolystoma xenopodis]|uniref:Uncharacterized protein n=1 Tax=Protopolystoma xenopodis TaxID=117903 RepID=A0A448X5P5_9PLAT|nr:unnamed protein product [Protopolystoma xenopodis]